MRKVLLKSAIIGVLFSFAACSSDSGSSSCEDYLAAFEAAEAKYEASGSEADCIAAANIVKDALAAKCISTEEAAAYAADLPCYTSGGDDNNPGDCEGIDYQSAIDAFKANKTDENCMYAVDQLEAAVDAGCLTEAQAIALGSAAGLGMCM